MIPMSPHNKYVFMQKQQNIFWLPHLSCAVQFFKIMKWPYYAKTWLWEEERPRSADASGQSDQGLCLPSTVSFDTITKYSIIWYYYQVQYHLILLKISTDYYGTIRLQWSLSWSGSLFSTYNQRYIFIFDWLNGWEHMKHVLRFYNPVNPLGWCQARSVYLTTLFPGHA